MRRPFVGRSLFLLLVRHLYRRSLLFFFSFAAVGSCRCCSKSPIAPSARMHKAIEGLLPPALKETPIHSFKVGQFLRL